MWKQFVKYNRSPRTGDTVNRPPSGSNGFYRQQVLTTEQVLIPVESNICTQEIIIKEDIAILTIENNWKGIA